ncbi:MAG: DUF1302 family protein [Candidatus Omnitrophota bacterium]
MKKHRLKLTALITSLAMFLIAPRVFAQELDEALVHKALSKVLPFKNLEFSGYLKNETGLHMGNRWDTFMKEKNIVNLQGNYKIKEGVDFFTTLRWFYDAAYDIDKNHYSSIDKKEKDTEMKRPSKQQWLRDCYLDVYTDKLDMRAGKQQVVWGTADGIRILDIINPMDYREWTLPDYSDIRIPLWMLNVEGELLANGHLQVLLVPDWQPNFYAPPGSPFTLRTVELGAKQTLAYAGNPFVTFSTIDQKPANNFENTKVGLRWRNVIGSGYAQGLEYTLNYYRGYDFASAAYTLVKRGSPTVITLTRRAERISVYGGTFSKTITNGAFGIPGLAKGWTIRGEFAGILNGAMNYGTDANIVGTADVDQYNYVLGFDKNLFTNWVFSFQLIQLRAHATESFDKFQYTLLNGATRGPLDKTETTLTCKLSTDFMHERLKPEVLVLYGDDNDWRISPKVSYEINDRWTVTGGFHVFQGKPQNLNGQFDKDDEVFVEAKYSF